MYRVARRIAGEVGGQKMSRVWFAFDHLEASGQVLTGRRLDAVETLGKALLLRFEDGTVIYTHNQLYGRWMFSDADSRPRTGRQLRLALVAHRRAALLYSASDIDVVAPGELESHPFIQRAGLDVLSSGAGPEAIAEWIQGSAFARRRLGHLLLDQSFLAGVGNYLRSEILFVAGLHWQRRPSELDEAGLRRLAEATHALMWRSVDTGGITNDPERARQLRRSGWARRDYRHHVFGREAQACFACGGPVTRQAVSGRRLYHCGQCQPAPA